MDAAQEHSQHVRQPVVPVEDALPPLVIESEREVFHEHGGADFSVMESTAIVRETGEHLQFHVASVKNGRPGAVCIVEQPDEHGNSVFLIARHWRVATQQWAWEFPRGMAKEVETPIRTAIRELAEETGMHVSSSQVTILQHIHADTGVLRDNIAVARITIPRSYTEHVENSDWELASLRWVPATTVQRMIANGEITDGITLAAWSVYCAQAPLSSH